MPRNLYNEQLKPTGAGLPYNVQLVPAAADLWTCVDAVDLTNGGADDQTIVNVATSLPASLIDIEISGWNIGQSAENNGVCLQLGDSGGFETTGYVSATKTATNTELKTNGFYACRDADNDAANEFRALWRLLRWDPTLHLWFCWVNGVENTGSAARTTFGTKTLSGELTQLRLTTTNGSATFDQGEVVTRYIS